MRRVGAGLVILAAVGAVTCSKERTEPGRAADHAPREPQPPSQRAHAGGTTSGPSPHQDESEQHEELPNKVRLPPAVARAAGLKTAPTVLDSLPTTVDLTGEIAADPDRSARLAARIPGRIIDVPVKEGDRVTAGQTVAILESPELARARAALASALARAKSARLNADRLKSLEAKSLASGQEASAAEAEAASLDAEVSAAKQTLSALGQGEVEARNGSARVTIRTPLAGFVLSRDAVRGQSVDAEHVIAVIGDLDRVYFLGRLFEKDLSRMTVGASAEVRLNAYPSEAFDGKIETIGRQLDPAARTVTARIVVRNHGDLVKVGLFGTARVVVGPAETPVKRVVVPLAAVTRVADKDVVFVLQPDGDFELHPVTLGRTAGGRVEVLSGLRAGERVVTEGVFTLKSAVLKSTFGEGE
jgi:cobalt-zinc-cadmium efflux system membrane fusion protein